MMPLFIFLVLLCEICQVAGDVKKTSGIMQDTGVITAAVGDNVTLRCVAQDEVVTFLSWYQQRLGDKPQLISTRMKHKTEADVFPPYKERFHASSQSQSNNHLTITHVRLEDSATYYCGILEFSAIEFGQGVFLHVKTPQSNIQHPVVHQSDLEPLRSGDSLKLNCTVYIESPCAGEQNLYWYRHGAFQPAVMDPSAGQCTSVSNKKPHMKHCALSLAIKSVSASDAGMYYCALRSCGEIVFGNGTRVDVGESVKVHPLLVLCLKVGLAVSIIMLLVLAFIMYKLKKTLCSVCKGTVSHRTCSAAYDATNQDPDTLHYAALSLKRSTERHRQDDNMETVCVYSRIKTRKE